MSGVILDTRSPADGKIAARSLIVAPRLPELPKEYSGNPFTSDGWIVADCNVPGCSWHACGERPHVGAAWREHYRQFHASAQETGVVLLNNPRQ